MMCFFGTCGGGTSGSNPEIRLNFHKFSTFSTTTRQHQMIKITNYRSLENQLFNKSMIQLFIISRWVELCNKSNNPLYSIS